MQRYSAKIAPVSGVVAVQRPVDLQSRLPESRPPSREGSGELMSRSSRLFTTTAGQRRHPRAIQVESHLPVGKLHGRNNTLPIAPGHRRQHARPASSSSRSSVIEAVGRTTDLINSSWASDREEPRSATHFVIPRCQRREEPEGSFNDHKRFLGRTLNCSVNVEDFREISGSSLGTCIWEFPLVARLATGRRSRVVRRHDCVSE